MSVKERMKGEERRLALADAHSLTLCASPAPLVLSSQERRWLRDSLDGLTRSPCVSRPATDVGPHLCLPF